MATHLTGRLVQLAHADAWQEQGRLRLADGGDRADLPGARLMSSGLPYPQWNTADVLEADVVDVEALVDWYAVRGIPWGVRVADGSPWPHGRRIARQRLMGQTRGGFRPAPSSAGGGAVVRRAGPADLDAVVAVDVAAFDGDPGPARRWLAPMLADDAVAVVLAEDDGGPVGTAYAVRSDDLAGPAVLLGGVAVVPRARRRGLASAMSSRLLREAYDDGARLGHLQPDSDAAAAVYARLGFVEVEGVEIRVDVGV
jgi:GNAT superfamily N-acetyltransferase